MFMLADQHFSSRLLCGTGKFPSTDSMLSALAASDPALVTLALKRVETGRQQTDNLLSPLLAAGHTLLPNTAGARDVREAVFAAELAREAMETHWIKLEVHPDPRYLMPDPVETLKAAEILVKRGFIVLPYVHADPVLCKRLEEVGCAAVMPLGAPIGSNRGLLSRDFLQLIIEQAQVPVIVDAGIGAPSHAAAAMEMGADAVLVNTAIATAADPVAMAAAFSIAVQAGHAARRAGLAAHNAPNFHNSQSAVRASATSPLTHFLDEAST